MDLETYEPILVIEEARFAGMSAPEYAALSPFWRGWYHLAHQAHLKADKQREQER